MKNGRDQPVHISLQHNYTEWNIFNCFYLLNFLITIYIQKLPHKWTLSSY